MRGFQPAGNKTLKKNSTGPVRGPGTGTSDEVADTVQEGTYIMPTDSTEAIGEQNLAAMGKGAPVDVQLSNGEFKLPPEQVHAIGVQALDQMKDATHTPVAARGFAPGAQQEAEPPMFFADGGSVRGVKRLHLADAGVVSRQRLEEEGRVPQAPVAQAAPAAAASPNQASPTNIFPQSSPAAGANIYSGAGFTADQFGSSGKFAQVPNSIGQRPGRQQPAAPAAPAPQGMTDAQRADALSQIPTDGPKAPAADGSQGAWRNTEVGRNISNSLAALPGMGGAGRVASTGGVISKGINAVSTAANNAGRIANTVPVVGPSLYGASEPAAAAAQNPNAAAITPWDHAKLAGALGGLDKEMAAQSRVDSVLNKPTSASTGAGETVANNGLPTGVYNHGRGQYSDQAEGMGLPAGFTGRPNAQNMAAADALAQRSQQESMSRVMAGQPVERGWSGVIGTDPAAGNAARERRDLVSSLMTPLRGAQNGQLTAHQRNGMLSLLDQEARGAQAKANNATTLQQTEMQTNTQRDMTAMREAGDNSRAVLREAGETGRADSRNAIDQGRLDLEQKVRGFDIRTGQRQEKLYEKYDAAKTPEEKSAIVQQIRDLSGKADQANRYTVVPGGQEWDATAGAMRNVPGRVLNNQTGQFVEQQGATSAQPAGIPKVGDTRDGYRYKGGNPNDKANWQKV